MSEVPAIPVVEAGIQSGAYHQNGKHIWYAKLTISLCPVCGHRHKIMLQGDGEIPTTFNTECQRSGDKIVVTPYQSN